MGDLDFNNYLSPLSWRYGTAPMRELFSEHHKYDLWRTIWVALARVQHKTGLVSKKELDDLVAHKKDLDIKEILTREKETRHDVAAAIGEFASKAKVGGGKIHLGATSMDIVDNADAMRTVEALTLTQKNLQALLQLFAIHIRNYAEFACMGYTHLQPAEPTTVGYRLAFYGQDLLTDMSFLSYVQSIYKGKGMKGAVGTRASYEALAKDAGTTAENIDTAVMKELGIEGALIATQVYPRKFDYLVLTALASIASSVSKFAADLRILQSPAFGEWSEPFGKKQVGSSAMPFKKNPVNAEKICSLARYIAALPAVALENASLSHLERTLDDSANKRIIFSEAFIALDEILLTANKIVEGLVINTERIEFNLNQYAPFAATELLLISLVKHGADRQAMHELLREISMECWAEVAKGKPNRMHKLVEAHTDIKKYLTSAEIGQCFDVSHHIGDAPQRALRLADQIQQTKKK
jgi:adenylosuccinate lyase